MLAMPHQLLNGSDIEPLEFTRRYKVQKAIGH